MSEEIEKKWRGLMELWMEIEYYRIVEYLDEKVKTGRTDEKSAERWRRAWLKMIGKDEKWGMEICRIEKHIT